MSPTILDAPAIAKLIDQLDTKLVLSDMFMELANGSATQPPQSLVPFPSGNGDFIGYLGVLEREQVFGVKLSPYIIKEDGHVVTAWTCLMSMQTGLPLLLCDAGQLTTERTAGTTALAVDLLADKQAKSLAIIGSGSVAAAHWQHVSGLRDWDTVRIWSPNLKANADVQSSWSQNCPSIEFAESAEMAAQEAEVVMLCTSSGVPVICPTALSEHALVTSISTNVAQAHEVPAEFLLSAEVYCDYRLSTPLSAGDMVIATRDHGWSSDSLKGDLGELVAGKCELPTRKAPIFFRSIGLGLEDIAMANAVHKHLTDSATTY